MKIVIFGASGTVGIELVKQALEQGYEVTAFVRSPEKLANILNINLHIYKGDVLNAHDVENVLKNQDAILCALGDGNVGKIRSAGTKNIVDAMNKLGIKRLVCQTTLGMGDSYQNLNFIWKYLMFGILLRKAFQDHKLQEESILKSNLNYTIVRPSALMPGEIKNEYKIGFDGNYKDLTLKISRKEVASFMINQLQTQTYLRRAVSISN
jgi:putative NADH-flavin reductase